MHLSGFHPLVPPVGAFIAPRHPGDSYVRYTLASSDTIIGGAFTAPQMASVWLRSVLASSINPLETFNAPQMDSEQLKCILAHLVTPVTTNGLGMAEIHPRALSYPSGSFYHITNSLRMTAMCSTTFGYPSGGIYWTLNGCVMAKIHPGNFSYPSGASFYRTPNGVRLAEMCFDIHG